MWQLIPLVLAGIAGAWAYGKISGKPLLKLPEMKDVSLNPFTGFRSQEQFERSVYEETLTQKPISTAETEKTIAMIEDSLGKKLEYHKRDIVRVRVAQYRKNPQVAIRTISEVVKIPREIIKRILEKVIA